MDEIVALEDHYGVPIYQPLPVVISRGKGVWVWDRKGKKYMDMLSAFSALSHGHAHPRIVKVLKEQAEQLAVTSRAVYNDKLGPFLKALCEISGFQYALPMNSGVEAVETAIKAARQWGHQVKKIPNNQAEIIVAKGNFHGRTTTVISFSSEPKYKDGFGPFTPGFKEVPFGDAQSLEAAITPKTCAFLVEPMQGEAGIKIPPPGWLKSVEQICKKHNILLLLDEIQTGLARTGKTFAFEHDNVRPDGLILGKALGGGLLPVSAFLANKEVMELFTPGRHGTTFGGNPLAAAVGIEALAVIQEEKFAERSATLGTYFIQNLEKMRTPWMTEIRGKGLWIGIDIDPKKSPARKVCELLLERGIVAKDTHDTVVRLAPPLIITKEEIDWALEQVQAVIKKML